MPRIDCGGTGTPRPLRCEEGCNQDAGGRPDQGRGAEAESGCEIREACDHIGKGQEDRIGPDGCAGICQAGSQACGEAGGQNRDQSTGEKGEERQAEVTVTPGAVAPECAT